MHHTALFAVAILAACQSALSPPPPASRYLVTERAIDVGLGIRLCIAVDVNDTRGVRWWGAGRSGCASRSTGPTVSTADGAAVSPTRDGGHTVRFRVGTHSLETPFLDVRLMIESGTMRLEGGSEKVPLVPRADLEIPELP